MVERWGLRIQHVGKRGLCNTGQKRNEKKEKHIFTYMPANEAMAAAGVGAREGCDVGVVACVPADGIVRSSLLCAP